ncbi:LytR/AlgR family response regulator transcription factor [Pedobacter sp. KBS0701]|uniref:LytR/AlgR family response regulator transcription factor n=1 Tax=unclassified Pedobacter TaxID=2628915 RepID=UPI00110D30C6|nr:LytTR family DNA-binding domain-containing protein [Pedobacter sp. KBS0701]QDW23840.1 response regulator transcription factor [Pedobacter sp. KBS0701]
MKALNIVIIDDEEDSISLLRIQLKKHCGQVGAIYSFNSPIKALQEIESLNPDLVFLDIEMPELNGFQLLEKLMPISFKVVFTTAYNEFAIKAFRFSALDYLVKPVDIKDLVEAVNRAVIKNNFSDKQLNHFHRQMNMERVNKIAVSSLSGIVFINLDDILYVEASSNYSILVLLNGEKVIISKTLKDVQEILEDRNFFRIHRQYIINLNKVKFFNKNDCLLTLENNKQLQVARIQKDKLIEKFGAV